jgi:hypothetical protein
MKAATRDPGGSNLVQSPYCYMRPSAKRTVKPNNRWLPSNLNGAAGEIKRAANVLLQTLHQRIEGHPAAGAIAQVLVHGDRHAHWRSSRADMVHTFTSAETFAAVSELS